MTNPIEIDSLCLENRNIDRVDLSKKCLIGVIFRRCQIRFVNFEGSDLSYCIFEDCDLYSSSFRGSVLYTTRFKGCDVTKADFSEAFLNGIRAIDTDITHTVFGEEFEVGKNRKPIAPRESINGFLQLRSFENLPVPAPSVEKKFSGILCQSTGYAISFFDDPLHEEWRSWRRRSEAAKTVERLMIENGYRDRSLPVYFRSRYYSTRSVRNPWARWLIIIFIELMWGYGIKLARPVTTWFVMILFFAVLYLKIPSFDPGSGLIISNSLVPLQLFQANEIDMRSLFESIYFSSQVSTLSVYGEAKPVGWARMIALAQQVLSVLGVGLGTAVLTRRIGNVG